MNKKIHAVKAIFFDIDGTLLSFKTHRVPESARKALEQLKEKGIKLFIATGRPPTHLEHLKEKLNFPFDGYVSMNGQYCFNDEQVIYEQHIPGRDMEQALKYMEEQKIACEFIELDYIYLNRISKEVLKLRKLMGDTAGSEPVDDINRVFSYKTYQICPFIKEDEEEYFFEYLPGYRGVRWHPLFVDIIPEDGGKAFGIQRMLDHYGIALEESMAFGDGGNDIEMLEYVPVGVAMGNADGRVKESADYVTKDVDEDGIAFALENFGIL